MQGPTSLCLLVPKTGAFPAEQKTDVTHLPMSAPRSPKAMFHLRSRNRGSSQGVGGCGTGDTSMVMPLLGACQALVAHSPDNPQSLLTSRSPAPLRADGCPDVTTLNARLGLWGHKLLLWSLATYLR
ncbi:hypothetical protein P7K49_018713 [Saguinus oedipus]|uniref:Uncharacterized protein n=1 Tax=Saguinus oedipus TaxID=9490 RepID=A0ABQ9V8X4_SAGOE|nr:hypothetical protein P7K49_018713 [Saguinus oedipus]